MDLHIHTVATRSDSPFTFSLDTFKRYVNEPQLGTTESTVTALGSAPLLELLDG